jgi:putative tryptophan/tyrosine transport system substrate-binding protein
VKRRAFISLLGGAAAAPSFLWPLAARGQPSGKLPRVGILSPGRSELPEPGVIMLDAFVQGLHELGYADGRNLILTRHYGELRPERLRELAAELAGAGVNVIVALSTPAALAAKQATSAIPIVAIGMGDPVADGLVDSLAQPGGNVTGTTFLGPELAAKRLQLFKDIIPGLSHVAALWHPHAYSERTTAKLLQDMQAAAQTLGLRLELVPADSPDEIDGALAAIVSAGVQGLIVMPSPMLFAEYKRIVALAAASRLPGMGAAREFATLGGLASYGVNLSDLARQSARHVDRILKGAKPSALPVEQPTKFELVINLQAARDLGLTITREFQMLVDEVIE